MATVICQASLSHGLCTMRNKCQLYHNTLALAVDHVNIKLAIKSKAVTEVPAKFMASKGGSCVNFKTII